MINLFKFPDIYDVDIYMDEVKNNDFMWELNNSRQKNNYEQQETNAIRLRQMKNKPGIRQRDNHETYEMPYFPTNFPNIKSFTENFIEKYGGKLEMVMIVSLPPEKTVYPHFDDGEYYKIRDRFHLVLQGIYQYNVGEETAIFSKGELWFFENQVEHDSKNIGSVDRISVIFDVLDSNWREICNVN